MGKLTRNAFEYIPFQDVTITDTFWSKRVDATYTGTLPAVLEQLKVTGRWDVFRLMWRPGDPNVPHIFWDSDTAKFLEAACYALMKRHDNDLREHVEQQIGWIRTSQWDDGYVNSYFTLVEPQNRLTNLRDCHELYCAGHLLEAAIAHYQLTQHTYFLNTMLRYITLIQSTFGTRESQLHGYPGHEEIELALMKLYHITNAPEHLHLASYFIEERGQRRNGVHYYELEAKHNGVTLWPGHFKQQSWFEYMQAGQPIRQQTSLEGHAVRAMYFLCGVSDVALQTNDTTLLASISHLYKDLVNTKMYITYGIGSIHQWEGFGPPYDLPNDTAYCETCASIGVVYLTHRLLKWDWGVLAQQGLQARDVADVLEGALYNAVGGGMSIDGKAFFYANPLETSGRMTKRKDWFDTSCCPPNVARLFCSLGEYSVLVRRKGVGRLTVALVLYMTCRAQIDVDGIQVTIVVETNWPSTGQVDVRFENAQSVEIELLLRVPGWAENFSHGNAMIEEDGFLHYPPTKYTAETISLTIPFPVQFIKPNPHVWQNQGKIAIRRGPFIFAMESADNDFTLSDAELISETYLEETITMRGIEVKRIHIPGRVKGERKILKFIPYWSWGNRENGDVLVWCKTG